PIGRVINPEQVDRAGDWRLNELHFASEDQGNDLSNNGAQSPGRKNGIQRSLIEPSHDDRLRKRAAGGAGSEGSWQNQAPRHAKPRGDKGGVGPERQEGGVSEVDDLHDPEHKQKTGRDDEEQSRRRDGIEGKGQHASSGRRRETEILRFALSVTLRFRRA